MTPSSDFGKCAHVGVILWDRGSSRGLGWMRKQVDLFRHYGECMNRGMVGTWLYEQRDREIWAVSTDNHQYKSNRNPGMEESPMEKEHLGRTTLAEYQWALLLCSRSRVSISM